MTSIEWTRGNDGSEGKSSGLGSRPIAAPATPPGAAPEPWAAYAMGCDACEHHEPHWHAGKNGDPSEWESHMRVRMFPGDTWPEAPRG